MIYEKRYFLMEEQCKVNLSDFYKNVARTVGYSVTDKTYFDCRKIYVTASIMEALWCFYSDLGLNDEQIATTMLLFGPKANLDGNGYEFTIENGFITEIT